MLYTVHTRYRAFDVHTGTVRYFCQTDKVDCPDKETAKTYCWQRILDDNPYSAVFESQNARASHRENRVE